MSTEPIREGHYKFDELPEDLKKTFIEIFKILGSSGESQLNELKRQFKYVSIFCPKGDPDLGATCWFINAPNIATAREELRKALRKFIAEDADPEEFQGIDAEQYQKRLIASVKPLTRRSLSRFRTDEGGWEDRLTFDLNFMSELESITPNVSVAEYG